MGIKRQDRLRNAARLEEWGETGAKLVHGGESSHTCWLAGFNKGFAAGYKQRESDEQFNLAIAQFTGYVVGRREPGVLDLVVSMGLTREEWRRIRSREPHRLNENEVAEIDEYFRKEAKDGSE